MKTLQERLVSAYEWHAPRNEPLSNAYLLQEAAQRIDELESTFRWIPISEQMPEPQVNVFVRQTNGQVGVCAWWGSDYKFDITHWMSLPPSHI